MNVPLLLLSLAILAFAIFQLIRKIKLSKSGIKMEAEIIDVIKKREQSNDSDGYSTTTNMYYPIFKYEYEGQTYEKQSNSGVSNPRKFKVGNMLKIVFMSDKPEKAEVDNLMGWIIPIVLILVFVVLISMSLAA